MPRFLITQPTSSIRSGGRTGDPTRPAEPRRARAARAAARRRTVASFLLFITWAVTTVAGAPQWVQGLFCAGAFYLLFLAVARHGWARGFTEARNTPTRLPTAEGQPR